MDINNAKFEMIKDIGSGNFGVAKLMKDRLTGELVAVKFIERGDKIDKCDAAHCVSDAVREECTIARLLEHHLIRVVWAGDFAGLSCLCALS